MLISVLFLVPLASCRIISTGTTFLLNGIAYFASPHSIANVSLPSEALEDADGAFGLVPVSVLAPGTQPDDLVDTFETWKNIDDVFQPGFTQLILNNTDTPLTQRADLNAGTSTIAGYTSDSTLPKGPYFLQRATGTLHQAYRLYDDTEGAFTESLLENHDGTFQVLSAKVPGSASMTIGVPSRLYYKPSPEKPLAGVRVAVKDIFSIAGVKKSNGNRAWYHLYPPNNVTATAISRLVEAGAVIVGTQKLSQFATSEVATADWVDYHSPFNPRGDGYQDPSSSSSGAGASVASYAWLDAAVGTDTGGSIRSPAGVNGAFGNRATHGIVSLDSTMPLSEPFDTAGFLVRDPGLWDRLQAAMYGVNYTRLGGSRPKYPTSIVTVDYPDRSDEAGRLLNEFADALAKFVGGKVTTLDIEGQWQSSEAIPDSHRNFTETFNVTYPVLTGKGQDDSVRKPFYADYAARYDGRSPPIDPSPLARWAWADDYSWDEAMHNKTLFMDWFNDHVLPPARDELQCSSGLILYPGKTGKQVPRNSYDVELPAPFTGFSAARMSVFSGCPDSVYPVGEISSWSNVTNHEEKFPVAVGVLAARGCDGLLARLAIDLVDQGILKVPRTGGTINGGPIFM